MKAKRIDKIFSFQSDCPESCSKIKYSFTLTCQKSSSEIEPRLEDYGNDTEAYFKKDLSVILKSLFYENRDFVKKRLERVSFIHLNFDDSQATLVTKDAHFTPYTIIGDIGGILGIFLGFSCVGIIDMVIMVIESLLGTMKKKKIVQENP